MEQIPALKRLKSDIDDDWQESLGHVFYLAQKMRQIEQVIGGSQAPKNITFDTQEVQADLTLIKSIVLQFNALCNNSRNDFASAKDPIVDEKWFYYSQYPTPDITTYVAGCRLKGAISYIKDSYKGLFYFKRSATKEISSVYGLLQKKTDLKHITDLSTLASGDLIALQVDDQIQRALVEVTTASFNFFCVDTGEEVKYHEKMKLYQMAEHYKNLSALAILCKCDDLSKTGMTSAYMRKNLHQEVKVEVVKVKYNTFHVKFVDPEDSIQKNSNENTRTSPSDLCEKKKKISKKRKRKTACAKKDTLTSTKPIDSGIGMELMQKMGWRPGEGLGKDKSGILTPILVEVKNDRLGLAAANEKKAKAKPKKQKPKNKKPKDQTDPVTILHNLAIERKWVVPHYDVVMENVIGRNVFVAKLNLNGVEYEPKIATNSKKEAKKALAAFCLKQIRILSLKETKSTLI